MKIASKFSLPTAAAVLAALAIPAQVFAGSNAPAPEDYAVAVQPAETPDLIFTLRGGAAVAPAYFGSDDYEVGPDFSLGINFLRLPGGYSFGSADPDAVRQGFGLRGSLRYIGERSAADHAELAGLDDIDASLELGLGIGYSQRHFQAFGDVRYGVVGHESVVGELGADVVFYPTDRLTMTIGPRVFYGSDDYAATYFGVTAAESTASGGAIPAFSAGGGVLSAGVELGATYQINDTWGIEGAVSWDALTNDAADSPITAMGDKDQYKARIGLTRRFSLGF